MNHRLGHQVAVIAAVLLAPVAGCVPYKQFNTEAEEYLSPVAVSDGVSTQVDLAVIEFDEFGMFWDIDQFHAALDHIAERNAESDSGILVVMYVHGWQNNADPTDEGNDLSRFRSTLTEIAANAEKRSGAPSHVVGVYLGWRGVTSRTPVLKTFTFWDRRRGGERVAEHRIREVFLRVTQETKARPDSKLIISGHSMGGMIVGLSLGTTLETLLLTRGEDGFRSIVDGVYLLNPALDAMSTFQLVEFMKRAGVVAELRHADGRVEPAPGPVIVSITSEADNVTRNSYRIGQWLDRTRIDKRSLAHEGWPDQTRLSTWATGHLPFLASHRAFLRDGQVVIERIEGAWNDTPYWIITVTEEISRDHGDIYNPYFNDLNTQLINLTSVYDTRVQVWVRTDW